jgi:hypothetical protein
MAKYFHISSGLRGCYMPDDAYVIRVETRRELKERLEYEASSMRDAYRYGGSKKAVAELAADAWRFAQRGNSFTRSIPFGREPGNYPFGLFVSGATRADYVEFQKEKA